MNYRTFLNKTIKAWMPAVVEMYARPRRSVIEIFSEYKGLRGPKTFTGTPEWVVHNMHRYQKGLKP